MSNTSNKTGEEGVIDLRNEDEAEFKIEQVSDERLAGKIEATPSTEVENAASKSFDKVKVKFEKFVNLIANHSYEEIFEKHMDEDVIISTDLLADLANAHEEKGDRKLPVIFLLGILLGIVLTWILLRS